MATASFRVDDDLKARADRLSETIGVNPSDLFRLALLRVVEEAEDGGDALKLSLVERLMLSNQYRILEHLSAKERDPDAVVRNDDDHQALQQMLRMGYQSQYHDLVVGFDPQGMSVADSREVLDVLEMHRHLIDAFNSIDEGDDARGSAPVFSGFDGTGEAGQFAFAGFFLETLGRYPELQRETHLYNSHCPMLPTYRAMLEVWKQRAEVYGVSASEMRAILAAKPY